MLCLAEGSYRRVVPIRDSIRSLFGLHNETGNIYTHLLGAKGGGCYTARLYVPLFGRIVVVVNYWEGTRKSAVRRPSMCVLESKAAGGPPLPLSTFLTSHSFVYRRSNPLYPPFRPS